MPKLVRQHLFENAVKLISQCIEHLHDTDLSVREQRARETLVGFCDLLVQRWENPNYGRGEGKR
jgi:hypothetical protein